MIAITSALFLFDQKLRPPGSALSNPPLLSFLTNWLCPGLVRKRDSSAVVLHDLSFCERTCVQVPAWLENQ
jgi:hypothetical protein